MSSSDDQLPQHVRHFTVRANDEIIVDRCEKTHAELPLNPGTPYLLTVETSYSDGIHSMTSISEEYHYTTPTKDESMYNTIFIHKLCLQTMFAFLPQ